jgi:hypothetical protein
MVLGSCSVWQMKRVLDEHANVALPGWASSYCLLELVTVEVQAHVSETRAREMRELVEWASGSSERSLSSRRAQSPKYPHDQALYTVKAIKDPYGS